MNIKILLKTIVNNNLCQTPSEIKKMHTMKIAHYHICFFPISFK